ncbi:MAG: hypothetical protein ACC683_07185 [Acidimicrobiia bacterium]
MTTKQKTDKSTGGGNPTVDIAGEDAQPQVESASRELLAKARYDAFRLMTEAREEAESILDEARAEAAGTIKAAQISAEATAEKAKSVADATIIAAKEEVAAIVASAHRKAGERSQIDDSAALEAEHRALSERVSTLRTLADQLEDRFAALAKTAGSSPTDAKEPPPDSAAKSGTPILDYSPSPAAPAKPEESEDLAEPEPERDSFYNRRSANLPRLGEDGGRSALEMTRMIRESLDTE